MIWRIPAEFLTAGAQPVRWFSKFGEAFILGAVRESGGDDSKMVRRVIADGHTRERAWAALEETLLMYDPRPTLLYASMTRTLVR